MSDISFVYVSGTLDRAMGQTKKKVVARSHLVCGNCASWVHLETSGCEKKWADTRAERFVFTCKGCTEVAVLVKEVSGLKQMMEDMKETREQYRGKPDWTGGRTKEELFSGSDRWHQEKHYDLRWRLYHPENRYKSEQGGGRSRVFTGSKNRACDRESREDRGKRKGRDHTSTRRDEQHGQGRNNGDS